MNKDEQAAVRKRAIELICIEADEMGYLDTTIAKFRAGNFDGDDLLTLQAVERALTSQAEVGAWLIEARFSDILGNHWWHPDKCWVHDAGEAIRFTRKEDADAYIKAHLRNTRCEATEHMWPALTTPTQPRVPLAWRIDDLTAEGKSCGEFRYYDDYEKVENYVRRRNGAPTKITPIYPDPPQAAAAMSARLAKLKAQRDALNAEIKLIEEGIRKAEYDACYARQLMATNEHRKRDGKRPLTMTEFMAGVPVDDEGTGHD